LTPGFGGVFPTLLANVKAGQFAGGISRIWRADNGSAELNGGESGDALRFELTGALDGDASRTGDIGRNGSQSGYGSRSDGTTAGAVGLSLC
jgi:hypothetical protein